MKSTSEQNIFDKQKDRGKSVDSSVDKARAIGTMRESESIVEAWQFAGQTLETDRSLFRCPMYLC